jgi:hypothetical protein
MVGWWELLDKLSRDTKTQVEARTPTAGNPIADAVANVGYAAPAGTSVAESTNTGHATTTEAQSSEQHDAVPTGEHVEEEDDEESGGSSAEEEEEEMAQARTAPSTPAPDDGIASPLEAEGQKAEVLPMYAGNPGGVSVNFKNSSLVSSPSLTPLPTCRPLKRPLSPRRDPSLESPSPPRTPPRTPLPPRPPPNLLSRTPFALSIPFHVFLSLSICASTANKFPRNQFLLHQNVFSEQGAASSRKDNRSEPEELNAEGKSYSYNCSGGWCRSFMLAHVVIVATVSRLSRSSRAASAPAPAPAWRIAAETSPTALAVIRWKVEV